MPGQVTDHLFKQFVTFFVCSDRFKGNICDMLCVGQSGLDFGRNFILRRHDYNLPTVPIERLFCSYLSPPF